MSSGVRFNREQEEELRIELREVYYRYYGSSMGQIDPLQVIREAFVLVSRMHLRLPTRFALLDKALATLGGVGTEIYPDFNVFEVAEPYAAELVQRRYSPRRLAEQGWEGAESYTRMLMQLPYQVHDTLEQFRDGEVEVQFRHKGLDQLTSQADVVANRLVIAIVMAATIVASSLIGISADGGWHLFGIHVLALAGFLVASGLGVVLVRVDRALRPALTPIARRPPGESLNGAPRSCGWWAAPGKTASSALSLSTSTAQTAANAAPARSRADGSTSSQAPRATSTGTPAAASRSSGIAASHGIRSVIDERTPRRARGESVRGASCSKPHARRKPSRNASSESTWPVGEVAADPDDDLLDRRRPAGHGKRGRLDDRERAHALRPERCRQEAHDAAVGVADEVGGLVEERRDVAGVLVEVHPSGPVGARAVPAPVEDVEPPALGQRALLREGELAEAHAPVDEQGPRPIAPGGDVQVAAPLDRGRIGHVRGPP